MAQETRSAVSALVAAIPLFATLDGDGLSRALQGATAVEVPSDTVLFSRGDRCSGLYVLVSGRVKLALPGRGRNEKVIALVGPGESFEEGAVFLDEPHVVSAETLVAAKLAHVTKAALLACMEHDPRFANRIVVLLSRRLGELTREIESAVTLTGTQRVLDFLVGELPEAPKHGAATINLPAKKRVIASRLDLTHEHFSRILHDLAAANVLGLQRSMVTIPSISRLLSYRVACAQVARSNRSGTPQREPS